MVVAISDRVGDDWRSLGYRKGGMGVGVCAAVFCDSTWEGGSRREHGWRKLFSFTTESNYLGRSICRSCVLFCFVMSIYPVLYQKMVQTDLAVLIMPIASLDERMAPVRKIVQNPGLSHLGFDFLTLGETDM